MNCVFNGYLERSNLYKKIYISQSPADLGNSIGSALYVFHHILGGKRDLNTNTALFTGKPITENIEKLLDKYNLILGAKWHRTCFSGAINISYKNLNRLIEQYLNTFLYTQKKWKKKRII